MLNIDHSSYNRCTFAARRVLRGLAEATLALVLVVIPIYAEAQVLWYGGDIEATSPLFNNTETLDQSSISHVLTNFVVPENEHWHVTALFSNNLPSAVAPFTHARWSIRTGVAAGNLGTVVFSGVGPATLRLTGRTFPFNEPEVSITVSGLSLELGPGSYYLAVSPLTATVPAYMVSARVSNNRVGTTGTGGTFHERQVTMAVRPGSYTIEMVDSGAASLGVIGTATFAVPSFSGVSQIALLSGVLGLAGALSGYFRRSPALNRTRQQATSTSKRWW